MAAHRTNLVKSWEILHTDQRQCPDSCHQVSRHTLKHSGATKWARVDGTFYDKMKKKKKQATHLTNIHQKQNKNSSTGI